MKKAAKALGVALFTLFCATAVFLSCTDLPTGPADVPQGKIRGITLADWTASGYSRPSSMSAIGDISGVGSNRLVLIVTLYQQALADNTVRSDAQKTPTESSIGAAASRAVSEGLDVALKLHVDLDDGTWRGNIEPANPAEWFDSYGGHVLRWAQWAADNDIRQLIVGTELAGTVRHEQNWRELIGDVRKIYSGEVVYAASWDEVWMVPFWGLLDRVGVDFYAPVAERLNAGRVELLAGWQQWLDRLFLLHKQTGLPVLFTEIGYRSVDGAGMQPFAFGGSGLVDLAEQSDLYWAAMQATGDKQWIEGIYWWNWLASGDGGPENTDYTPAGKPATEELKGAWR